MISKQIHLGLFTASVIVLSFISCQTETQKVASEAPVVDTVEDDALHFAMINTHVDDKSAWLNDFSAAMDSIGGMQLVDRFYNMFDSTHVYVLLSADSKEKVGVMENHLKARYPDRVLGSIMMNEKDAVDMNLGYGEVYTFVTHRVKDFDNWHETFLAMEGVKNTDSIYTLGVFAEVNDQLNVGVLARAVSLGKTAAYARNLEDNHMLANAGVESEPDAIVLRRWGYKR